MNQGIPGDLNTFLAVFAVSSFVVTPAREQGHYDPFFRGTKLDQDCTWPGWVSCSVENPIASWASCPTVDADMGTTMLGILDRRPHNSSLPVEVNKYNSAIVSE